MYGFCHEPGALISTGNYKSVSQSRDQRNKSFSPEEEHVWCSTEDSREETRSHFYENYLVILIKTMIIFLINFKLSCKMPPLGV